MNPTTLLDRAPAPLRLLSVACLPLLFCSAGGVPHELDPTPLEGAIELRTVIRVGRLEPILALEDLEDDVELVALMSEIEGYSKGRLGPFELQDLVTNLSRNHDVVLQVQDGSESDYRYVTDEDGVLHKICFNPAELLVQDGGLSGPVRVEVIQQMVF